MNSILVYLTCVIGVAYCAEWMYQNYMPVVPLPFYNGFGHNPQYDYRYLYGDYSEPFVSGVRPVTAVCNIQPSSGSKVGGQIHLRQDTPNSPVTITGSIFGLEEGLHGFHVHQEGSTGNDCKAAGPHFNPSMATHGAPTDQIRHAGDLGNIAAAGNGVAEFKIDDSDLSLTEGHPRLILGRSIVIHQLPDDLGRGGNEESRKTGNAGARLGCCVIEVSRE